MIRENQILNEELARYGSESAPSSASRHAWARMRAMSSPPLLRDLCEEGYCGRPSSTSKPSKRRSTSRRWRAAKLVFYAARDRFDEPFAVVVTLAMVTMMLMVNVSCDDTA